MRKCLNREPTGRNAERSGAHVSCFFETTFISLSGQPFAHPGFALRLVHECDQMILMPPPTLDPADRNLALCIARCPNIERALKDASHPCRRVVVSQACSMDEFQVPEPWSGHLTSAPLLFVSSNPGFGLGPHYPTIHWPDDAITDYFSNRFGGGLREWIRNGNRALLVDGSFGKPVAFWNSVRRRAFELYERKVAPGRDYALTEVVHCKSPNEKHGVADASVECSNRYLVHVIAASAAKVIVGLGDIAERQIRRLFGIDEPQLSTEIVVGEHGRVFTFLPHPNARKPRRFTNAVPVEVLKALRLRLRQKGAEMP